MNDRESLLWEYVFPIYRNLTSNECFCIILIQQFNNSHGDKTDDLIYAESEGTLYPCPKDQIHRICQRHYPILKRHPEATLILQTPPASSTNSQPDGRVWLTTAEYRQLGRRSTPDLPFLASAGAKFRADDDRKCCIPDFEFTLQSAAREERRSQIYGGSTYSDRAAAPGGWDPFFASLMNIPPVSMGQNVPHQFDPSADPTAHPRYSTWQSGVSIQGDRNAFLVKILMDAELINTLELQRQFSLELSECSLNESQHKTSDEYMNWT